MTSAEDRMQLKQTVESIIVGQGNDFIKELLRKNNIKIGINKADFLRNMFDAIDEERLTLIMLEEWLYEIEGWGDQHIYLYQPLSFNMDQIKDMVISSQFADRLDRASTHEFPAELSLTNISITNTLISFSWHRGNRDWFRVKSKDFQRNEDGDLYDFRAFRQTSDRSVVRFEWYVTNPYCAIFMQQPNIDTIHEDILENITSVLREIGLCQNQLNTVTINNAVNSMSADPSHVTATSRTLRTDGGHIDLVSNLPDGGIEDVAAVREVSRAVNPANFRSSEGKFKLEQEVHPSLSRDVKLELFGFESRIRIWVKCKRDDVYTVIGMIWASN